MTLRTPQCEVFCPLLSSSEHSGVPEDSQPPTFPSVGLHPHTWPKWGCDKAPIEVHFADGVPHPTTSQAKEVPVQLGNWKGKVNLLISTLGGMDCVLGMEFITQNNVLIEGHNRLVRIPSKNGIVKVKAHKMPCVGGPTIHFML
jgi:hypothetical protein